MTCIFRLRYAWPDGRTAAISLAAPREQILNRAAEYVRRFTGGELLSISEDHPVARVPQQLTLEG